MFKISGLNLLNQNEINKAITKICKGNTFSNNKIEREQKKLEDEKNNNDLPDKLFNIIKEKFGENLAYNIDSNVVYYYEQPITKNDISDIVIIVQREKIFKNVPKYKIQTIINNVSKLRKFHENIELSEDINNEWNILHDVDPENWQSFFKREKGKILHNTYNYALFLTYHPQFKDKILYNMFDKIETLKIYDKDYNRVINKYIDDDTMHLIEAQIEQYFGDFNSKYVERAISVVLNNNSFHEIKQKFRQFENAGWDGKPRVHEIMIKYFGCEDREEIREMTEVMLCGSVQRILEEGPDAGTMFDYMGIQFGKQGTGKTKFMTRLYLGDKFTSINPDINDDQKFTDLTNRAWLVLFDELKSINKADMGTVKSRITEQGANVRLSYGRRSKYYPRHVAFWGNTNYTGVLRDEGYERRFLCFECNGIKHSAEWWNENYTDYDIEQIWAETLQIYHEKWENKVIQISQKTEEYNYSIQIKHKIWVEDGRTDLELKEILNYKNYHCPYYTPDMWRIWMKQLDSAKLGNAYSSYNDLKIVNVKWILSRINRRLDWITGMVENMGWERIHVDDDIFGNEDYFIRGDLNFDDIKNDYLSIRFDENAVISARFGDKKEEKTEKNDEKTDKNEQKMDLFSQEMTLFS